MNGTRETLIEGARKATGFSGNDCRAVFQALLAAIYRRAIDDGEHVEIRGFGVFRPGFRKKRIGRNIRTGARVMIPNRILLHWQPSKLLRFKINDNRGKRLSLGSVGAVGLAIHGGGDKSAANPAGHRGQPGPMGAPGAGLLEVPPRGQDGPRKGAAGRLPDDIPGHAADHGGPAPN